MATMLKFKSKNPLLLLKGEEVERDQRLLEEAGKKRLFQTSLCKLEETTDRNYQELPDKLKGEKLLDGYCGIDPCIDALFPYKRYSYVSGYLQIRTKNIKNLEEFDELEGEELEDYMYIKVESIKLPHSFLVPLFKADMKSEFNIEFDDDCGNVNEVDEYVLNNVVPFNFIMDTMDTEYIKADAKENPKEEDLYEADESGYKWTDDTTVVADKQYYKLHEYKVIPRFLFNHAKDVEEEEREYVPQGGRAKTVFGEFLRCCQYVCYRYINDGDNAVSMDAATISYANLAAIIDKISELIGNDKYADDLQLFVDDYLEYKSMFNKDRPRGTVRIDNEWNFKNDICILCNECEGDAALTAFSLEAALCSWKERDPDIFSEANDVDSREYLGGEWYRA